MRIKALFLLMTISGTLPAQTLLQRCLGIVPGREPVGKIGPSPATMSYCQQIPGWSAYEAAGQRFQAGDHVGAVRLLEQSASAGNAVAQLRLEMMYAKGDGVAVNGPEAMRWLKAAAAQGEPAAEDLLGTVYEYGLWGIPDNWDVSAKLWQASASQGWMNGEFSMGRAYQYGIGVSLNQQDAIFWYDKAAAQGHSQAAYFAKYLRDNHGADGSSRDDNERKLLGPLMGRMFSFTPPYGATFHHLSERLAYVRWEADDETHLKQVANYNMQMMRYRACKDAKGDNCHLPSVPRPE